MHLLEISVKKTGKYSSIIGLSAACLWGVLFVGIVKAQAEPSPLPGRIAPMRQDTIKMSPVPEIPRTAPSTLDVPSSGSNVQIPSQLPLTDGVSGVGYDPSGRRDPFAPIVQELQPGKMDTTLPPLQRVTLTELNLIAVVWGAYGYTAMVQTPEGHGYAVRRGTRIGQNNGVVSAITERGIIVQERFTDVYGKKQEREYVKLLHPKEGSE
jgi:type IV pilus assembly protein PilP